LRTVAMSNPPRGSHTIGAILPTLRKLQTFLLFTGICLWGL
jgi:hypothetical protein